MSGEAQAQTPAQRACIFLEHLPHRVAWLLQAGAIASVSSSLALFLSRDKTALQAWEGNSEPPSPVPLPSPSSWKGATENTPGGPEDAEEDQSGTGLQG